LPTTVPAQSFIVSVHLVLCGKKGRRRRVTTGAEDAGSVKTREAWWPGPLMGLGWQEEYWCGRRLRTCYHPGGHLQETELIRSAGLGLSYFKLEPSTPDQGPSIEHLLAVTISAVVIFRLCVQCSGDC
jgi:hypothetical protein